MYEPGGLAVIAGTFLLAGTVKGVIGLGLPSISLGLLAAALDLTSAMALLLAPSFVTNLWQALVGGHGRELLRRLWPFLFMATVSVWAGAAALTRVDLDLLSALLGVLLAAYGAASLAGMRFSLDRRAEARAGPMLGIVNGALTGMTGSFVVPGVMFLQAIGLPRDMLVQAMGILFTLSTLALGMALHGNGVLGADLAVVSAAGVVPALIGMVLGQRVRRRLPEQIFRRFFFGALLVLGGYIVIRAAG